MKLVLYFTFSFFYSFIGVSQLNTEKYISLAKDDLENQSFTSAIQRLNFAIKAKPYLIDAYFLRASAKYRLGDYKGATEDYTQCIRINPLSAASFQNRGIARCQYNDHNGAIEDYKMALKIEPLNYFVFIQKANSELQIEKYDDAVLSLDKAVSINPYLESAYLLRGMVNNELEKHNEAIIDFDKAIEISPTSSEPWFRKAFAYNALLQPNLALNYCDSGSIRDSTSSLGYFIKGNIYANQLDYNKASFFYSKVIELNPSNALAYYNRANARIKMDKYKNAVYDYSKVIEINPDNILAHFNLALTYHKMDKYELAEKEYTKVIELFPNMEDAWFNRAFVRKKMGNKIGAQTDYKKGESIRGLNREKKYNLEENEILKRFTKMDADFYHPNFNKEEYRIAILAIPFFELKSIDYKELNKKHLKYNTSSINTYNKQNKNTPYFYLANYLLNEKTQSFSTQQQVLEKQIKALGNKKDERIYLWQATIHKSNFDFNNAIATYDSLIELRPNSALAYFNKANTMLDLLELMLKLEATNVGFISPNDEIETKELSDVETLNIKLSEIENLYDKALELAPDFYYSWFNKGIVLSEQRDFKSSIEAYSKAIKINNQLKEAYLNRGLCYLLLDNTKKACQDFSKAGELGLPSAYNIIRKYCN